MGDERLSDAQAERVIQAYLTMLQRHPSAEEMISTVVTEDFETGFDGGHMWRGLDGLRDFLSQREGFFDERHTLKEILVRTKDSPDEARLKTRLEFFLRSWKPPSPTSDEYTGSAFHSWILRRTSEDEWRVAAQIVNGFSDLNERAAELFATPDSGLNR
jgi:hypothetical protein